MAEPTPVIICFDVEPDPREVDRSSGVSWPGFEKLLQSVDSIRSALEAASARPARFTWALRMDPQIAEVWGAPEWAAVSYAAQLADLTDTGDEVGLHPHVWRWHTPSGRWVADYADAVWVAHCANTALDAFQRAFGRPCAAYRQGDRAMTTELARLLDGVGVQVDLTVEPGLAGMHRHLTGELTTGWIESTIDAPAHPYRPSSHDFRIPDPARTDGLLMIPLTRGLGIELHRDGNRVRPGGRWETLVLWDQPERFRARLDRRLADAALTHLAFAVRSNLPLEPEWSSFEANLAELCRHPKAASLCFTSASDAAVRLGPAASTARAASSPAASAALPADMWALGSDDPGYRERADREAIRVLSDRFGQHITETEELQAHAQQLTERLGKVEAIARVLAARLDDADRTLRSVRETTTWRVHDRLLPLLRVVRRVFRGRRRT